MDPSPTGTTGTAGAIGMAMPPGVVPPLPTAEQRKDREHLRLLGIFHFIFGGLSLIGILGLVFHFLLMRAIFTNPEFAPGRQGAPPAEMLHMFIVAYIVMAGFLVLAAGLNGFSGWSILKRRRRVLSLVVAGLNCLAVPFGTVLGVFSFVVLTRDSVSQLYDT